MNKELIQKDKAEKARKKFEKIIKEKLVEKC